MSGLSPTLTFDINNISPELLVLGLMQLAQEQIEPKMQEQTERERSARKHERRMQQMFDLLSWYAGNDDLDHKELEQSGSSSMPQTTTVAEEDDWAGDIIAMLSLPQAGVAVDTAEVCAPRQGHSNTVYSQTPPDAEKENKQPTSVDVDVPFGVPHASTVVHQVQGENSVDWKTDGKGKGKGGEENEAEEQEDVVHPDALVSLFTTEILFPNGRKPLSKTSSAANEMASLPSYEPGPAAVPLMKKRPRVSDEDLQPVGAPQARAAPRTRAPKAKPPAVQATCLWAGCGKTFMTNAPATTLAHLKTHGEDVALLNAQGYLRCRWPGCIGRRVDDNGPGRFSSTAAWSRHVHSIHIMGKKLCPHGCGKLVGRGDAVKRHNERHHPELLKKARIEG